MALPQELDVGTPIRAGAPTVTLTIDGRKVSVPPGTSVMAAAALIDNPIPKLCATDSLEPFGSCRLCLVEIEGRKGTPASCTTPAEEGMVVHTQTARLERLRRGVMELYLSDHPLEEPRRATPTATTSCGSKPRCSASPTRDTGVTALTILMRRSTLRIPISSSTRRNASSARAACAPARRSREPSR